MNLEYILLVNKPVRLLFICFVVIVWVALITGAIYIFWPGADTLVINDTNRQVTLNNCGDAASSIPPGDVETLKPGDQTYIPSGKYQKGDICDVAFGNDAGPDACLPLPPHGGGIVKVSEDLKPYPHDSNDLCDAYIKL